MFASLLFWPLFTHAPSASGAERPTLAPSRDGLQTQAYRINLKVIRHCDAGDSLSWCLRVRIRDIVRFKRPFPYALVKIYKHLHSKGDGGLGRGVASSEDRCDGLSLTVCFFDASFQARKYTIARRSVFSAL